MEIARKGLTRLVCLLGEGSQQHQLHRAAASKRPFEKPVVKGWLRRGCALHVGWWDERHPSTAVTSYQGLQLLHSLMKKTWTQQALLTDMTWDPLSGAGQTAVLRVGSWRRTVARLKACLSCVSAEFLCWFSKEVALWSSLKKGRASHTWWYVRDQEQRGRLHSSTATPLHGEC